jgi:hypothetical protein
MSAASGNAVCGEAVLRALVTGTLLTGATGACVLVAGGFQSTAEGFNLDPNVLAEALRWAFFSVSVFPATDDDSASDILDL